MEEKTRVVYPRTIKFEDRIPRKKKTRKISGESEITTGVFTHQPSCEQIFIQAILRKDVDDIGSVREAVSYSICKLKRYFRPTLLSFGIKIKTWLQIVHRFSKGGYETLTEFTSTFSGIEKNSVDNFFKSLPFHACITLLNSVISISIARYVMAPEVKELPHFAQSGIEETPPVAEGDPSLLNEQMVEEVEKNKVVATFQPNSSRPSPDMSHLVHRGGVAITINDPPPYVNGGMMFGGFAFRASSSK